MSDQFEIVAETERPSVPSRVLKAGDTFAVFNHRGDMVPPEAGEHGLFFNGTRFLSRLELLLGRQHPILLSSTITDDNLVFTANMTNADVRANDRAVLAHGEIHVFRSRVLTDAGLAERIRVSNFALHPVELPLTLLFDADFADIFEVRGTRRARRGEYLPPEVGRDVILRYRGLDGVEYRVRLSWSRTPDDMGAKQAVFTFVLEPHDTETLELDVTCARDRPMREAWPYEHVLHASRRVRDLRDSEGIHVSSANERLDRWLRRSTADLDMMITETPRGAYPYAGIPWFSTPFGRDGLITAFELLWANPEIARGVLSFLADTQATSYSDAQDAQPGKILHEMRGGEMAALGEVPFGRYYGTVDATPLFVMLAEAYFRRTADRDFIDMLWPHVVAALDWMRGPGDPDGDGFIEYARRSSTGLVQQGWKDSQDSIFHADGTLAEAPIALCEVQGYAYGAWLGAARLADMRGDDLQAREWRTCADRLRSRFEDAFWCNDLGTYAIALDRAKRQCGVRTSNPGHCLFARLPEPARARRVVDTLMDETSFGGWGIRTAASGQARYNPMSYHNGSVWPHDNAVIAAGFSAYGFTGAAARVLDALFDLSQVVDLNRLPELICGFHRRGDEHPTLYPVACAPQAWAAGAVYLLLQASLGMDIDAEAQRISFSHASLPESIDSLRITNLQVANAAVDLLIERHPHDVGVRVLRRTGDVDIVSIK